MECVWLITACINEWFIHAFLGTSLSKHYIDRCTEQRVHHTNEQKAKPPRLKISPLFCDYFYCERENCASPQWLERYTPYLTYGAAIVETRAHFMWRLLHTKANPAVIVVFGSMFCKAGASPLAYPAPTLLDQALTWVWQKLLTAPGIQLQKRIHC